MCCFHSKSARRKKREDAQTLPEVSKEIYFDVSGDLKAVFGETKSDVAAEKEKTSWDQEEEVGGQDEESTLLSSADLGAEKEESAGFKFSFFGDDTETESKQTGRLNVKGLSQSVSGVGVFSENVNISLQWTTRWRASRRQRCHGSKTHVSKTAARRRMKKSRRKRRSKSARLLKPESEENQDNGGT